MLAMCFMSWYVVMMFFFGYIYILVHFIGASKKHFPNGWSWVLDLGRWNQAHLEYGIDKFQKV